MGIIFSTGLKGDALGKALGNGYPRTNCPVTRQPLVTGEISRQKARIKHRNGEFFGHRVKRAASGIILKGHHIGLVKVGFVLRVIA